MEQLGFSKQEIKDRLKLEMQFQSMKAHMEQRDKAKDAALQDFMENGMELVNKRFNMMADSEVQDLERTRKIEFEEKVAKCVQAIETLDNKTIDMMFEPKVIIKVTDKVYGKIMSQTDKTIDSLNMMIKKLETHQLGEFNSLEELKDLAYNLEMFRPQQNSKLAAIDKNLLKKEYIDGLLEETQDDLIGNFRKTNQKLVLRAIEIFRQVQWDNSSSKGCQTDDASYVRDLEQ